MSTFRYTRVGKNFLEKLSADFLGGRSVVLLGPRHSGKRYVLQQLNQFVRQQSSGPVVTLWNLSDPGVSSEESLDRLIRGASGRKTSSRGSKQSFEYLTELHRETGRPVFLLAANVDGLPHHVSRRFLRALRAKVLAGEVIAALTGEYDFRDLVHGPDSEFNVAPQYLLQGLDRDVFQSFLARYSGTLSLNLDSTGLFCDRLWRLTGGSIYLLRILLGQAAEGLARGDSQVVKRLYAGRFPVLAVPGGTPLADTDYLLLHADRVLLCDPDCWQVLEQMVARPGIPVSIASDRPSTLEFAGLVIRDPARRTISFSSPMVRTLATRYYNTRRIADLYSLGGRWEQAFRRYEKLSPSHRMRPSNAADMGRVSEIVSALESSIHSEALVSGIRAKARFECGCRLILGFRDVSFWRFSTTEWVPQESGRPKALSQAAKKILVRYAKASAGLLKLGSPYSDYALAATMPGLRSDEREAVIIGDFQDCTPISRERLRLATSLLRSFVEAHGRSVTAEANQIRVGVRDRHVEIIKAINESFARRAPDVNHVLKMAAEGLRSLGYYRVELCFVDPSRQRVKGVVDLSDNPTVNVANLTDWPLDEPRADIQPYVIHTKKYMIVPDPGKERLINKEVHQKARLRPLAIVPILTPAGLAIGTIHIERHDRAVPTTEEAEDLLFFGRQLANTIEHGEHIRLLEAAVDENRSSIVVFGLSQELLYVNQPAAKQLKVKAGWRDSGTPERLSQLLTGVYHQEVQKFLANPKPSAVHVAVDLNGESRGGIAHLDAIDNWQGEVAAGILRIEDLDFIEKVFNASIRMAGANDDEDKGFETLVTECLKLGPRWVRLYLINDDPDTLESRLWGGEGSDAAKARFKAGELKLRRTSEPVSAWEALQKRLPQVYCYDPRKHAGEIVFTERGLPAQVVTRLSKTDLFTRRIGEFWIDFPLYSRQRKRGKLTLDCKADFEPEYFEFIKILCEHISELLDVLEYLEKRMEFISREAVERTLATLAHNLATRIASLPGILRLYQKMEHVHPELKELKLLNADFKFLVENALKITHRAKEMLGGFIIHSEPVEVVTLFRRSLQTSNAGTGRVIARQPRIIVGLDAAKIETAVAELVRNSTEAAKGDPRIRIELRILKRGARRILRVSYRDSGPGMPAEIRDRVFDDFYTYPAGQSAGLGLGLSFVRRVIEAHGGKIWVASEPRKGATFIFELPA